MPFLVPILLVALWAAVTLLRGCKIYYRDRRLGRDTTKWEALKKALWRFKPRTRDEAIHELGIELRDIFQPPEGPTQSPAHSLVVEMRPRTFTN